MAAGTPVLAELEQVVPADKPELVWPLVSLLLVLLSVPVLAIIDFANRLTGHSALVRRLLGDIRDTARELAATITESEASNDPAIARRVGDLKSAVKSMNRITTNEATTKPRRKKLIELLK